MTTGLANETTRREKRVFRFDVFKGTLDGESVRKVRSVGVAYHVEGNATYRIYLKTFLEDRFFLLPSQDSINKTDYSILTRAPSVHSRKKYFWHVVGTGKVLGGEASGLMKLNWDVLGAPDIYMNLNPFDVREAAATEGADAPSGLRFESG